jgi:hypothetical protein
MTLKTIRDSIKAIIGNDTELQNADYDVFINEGKRFIEAEILRNRRDFFPGNESISVTSGDIDHTPTSTWENITLIQIDFNDGAGYQTLRKVSLEEALGANSTDTRVSLVYALWGNDIYIPNFGKAATMRIYGYILPAQLSTDGDEPTFSELLHPLLITWGVGRAIESSSSSENFLDGGRKRQEFFDELAMILPTVILKDSTNVKSLV